MAQNIGSFDNIDEVFKDPVGNIKRSLVALPSNPSAMLLVFANIVFIIFAIFSNLTLQDVLLVYWSQSIIIGFFTVVRMIVYPSFLDLPKISLGNEVSAVETNLATKIGLSLFFIFHYGLFHLVYFFFIGGGFRDFGYLIIGAGLFFITHLVSFIINYKSDISKKWELGVIMLSAYPRIIPMHMGIIFGALIFTIISIPLSVIFGSGIAFRVGEIVVMCSFLLLKIAFDLVSHDVSHETFE